MLNTKVDCNESGGTHDSRATRREHKEQHKIHTSRNKSEATARRGHTRLKLGEGPPGCLGSVGEGCMHAKPGTRLGSEPRTAPPHPPPHAHTLTQAHTRHRKASNDASSSTRRGCRTRRSRTGSRCRRNAGESRLPRSSPLLCACRQHAGSQHWSHRSHPGGAAAGAIASAS